MFTQDNTEGFTDAQIAVMNDEYERVLITLSDAVIGDDQYQQMTQYIAEAVLKRHGGA